MDLSPLTLGSGSSGCTAGDTQTSLEVVSHHMHRNLLFMARSNSLIVFYIIGICIGRPQYVVIWFDESCENQKVSETMACNPLHAPKYSIGPWI